MTTFAEQTRKVDALPPELQKRILDLSMRACQAFWKVVVEGTPQATAGDFTPLDSVQIDAAMNEAVRQWLENNDPTYPLYVVAEQLRQLQYWPVTVRDDAIQIMVAPYRVVYMRRQPDSTGAEELWFGTVGVLPNLGLLSRGIEMEHVVETIDCAVDESPSPQQIAAAIRDSLQAKGY